MLLLPSSICAFIELGLPLMDSDESWMPLSPKPELVGPAFEITPAVSMVRARAPRPLIGRSVTRLRSMTSPSVAPPVSISGASPTTSTTSVSWPISNVTLMSAFWPTCNVTPERKVRRKPSDSTAIS